MKKFITITLLLAAAVGMALAQQLDVSPNPAEVMPGGVVLFSVPGQEQTAVIWQVLPPSLGSIDADGRFTAGNSAGQGIVRAAIQNGDQKFLGHALVKITGNKIKGLTVKVSPALARLEPGSAAAFSAEVSYLNGDPATAVISWQVVPAGLGTIDPNGIFTSLNPGTGRIVALAKSEMLKGLGQAKITVGPKLKPQKLMVEMSPVKANLKPGENAVFSVTVNDRDGNPAAARLEFQVEPPALGVIDGSGNFTAGEKPGVGMIKVLAKNENGSGAAKSLVVVEEKTRRYTVKVKPRQSALEPGQSLEFTAEAFDNSGNPVIPPYWVWKVIPEKLGEISPQGVFTAGQKVGQGKLVASLPSQFGQGQAAASIRIKRGQPLRVKIDPPAVMLLPGEDKQFTATVFSPEGRPLPETKVIWKAYPEGIGNINQNGFFRASALSDKKGMIVAIVPENLGGGKGAAGVSISKYKITINGKPFEIRPNAPPIQLTASVADPYGSPPPGPYTLTWELGLGDGQVGTITSSGIFTAGNPHNLPASCVVTVKTVVFGAPLVDKAIITITN